MSGHLLKEGTLKVADLLLFIAGVRMDYSNVVSLLVELVVASIEKHLVS